MKFSHLDFLRLVDALLIIADVKMILNVEQLVDIGLLTCHLGRMTFRGPRFFNKQVTLALVRHERLQYRYL